MYHCFKCGQKIDTYDQSVSWFAICDDCLSKFRKNVTSSCQDKQEEPKKKKTGILVCKGCQTPNEYAEVNEDEEYVCYSCRNY